MSFTPNLRMLGMTVAVVLAWMSLWRDISWANLVSGIAIAAVLLLTGLLRPSPMPLRIVPFANFIFLVIGDLLKSTWAVVYEVLTPTDYTEEGIIAVDVPAGSCDSFLLLTVAITITPGTAVVDVDREKEILYLHLLHLDGRDEVEAHVLELAELALAMRGVESPDTSEEAA